MHAVRAEWAMTLADVLLRRTAIGLAACQGLDRLDTIADLVGGLLGWDPARRAAPQSWIAPVLLRDARACPEEPPQAASRRAGSSG